MGYPVYIADPQASVQRLHRELFGQAAPSPLPGLVVSAGFPRAETPTRPWVPTCEPAVRQCEGEWKSHITGLREFVPSAARRPHRAWRLVGAVAGQASLFGIVMAVPILAVIFAGYVGIPLFQ